MKILVTGGAGFIGKHLVKSLLKDNTVRIYDNLENGTKESIVPLIESGAHFIKGDILDYESLRESCMRQDIMIHLAAKSDVTESVLHPEITDKVNVNGTINVLKCCIENKIKKIVFASSAAVYGECIKLPITEESETNPISQYGKSKLLAEKEIKKFSNETGLDYVILRIFNVYGKGQNKNYVGVISKFSERILENKSLVIWGDGTQTRDFVSVNDVVESFGKSIMSSKKNTYNIESGEKISIAELAELMIDISGKKLDIIFEEEKIGDVKNSFTDTAFAKKELGFFAERNLRDYLSI